MKLCTKAQLQEEARRLDKWIYNEYFEYDPSVCKRVNHALSSRAARRIQDWIDTDSAWCRFLEVDDWVTDVSLFVAEHMRAVVPRRRVVFFATTTPRFRRNCNINDRVVGNEIGALALLYSVAAQLVDALPDDVNTNTKTAAEGATIEEKEWSSKDRDGDDDDDDDDDEFAGLGCEGRATGEARRAPAAAAAQYPLSVLSHLRAIDGTRATYPAALSAVYHLLGLVGGGGVMVMIDRADLLQADEVSSTIFSSLMGLLAGATVDAPLGCGSGGGGGGGVAAPPLRLWLTYGAERDAEEGHAIYQSGALGKAKRFRLRPGLFRRKYSMKSCLRFGGEAGAEMNGGGGVAGKGEQHAAALSRRTTTMSAAELMSPSSVRSDVSRLDRIDLPFRLAQAQQPRGG